jgi:hypothetical protein
MNTMTTHLTGSHRATHNAIFQHPVAHNVRWRDVRSLLAALGKVVEEPNGKFKVTLGGQTLVLQPSQQKDIAEVEQLMQIRHFLERSGAMLPQSATEDAAKGSHLLVVIDHREARIYKAELHGSVPERVTPYDPHGFGRYLHNVQDESNGQRKPERKTFYEAVARTLQGAQKILMFGSSTGASSAMGQLLAELHRNHPEIAHRVVGAVTVDEQHLSDGQLLAKAREFYATLASQGTTGLSAGQEGSAVG